MAIADWDEEQRTGQPCPKCGAEIVYNGNYFCSEYTMPEVYAPMLMSPATCDWAMPEHSRLLKKCYEGLMKNRERRNRG
jgi:hypothetical protein